MSRIERERRHEAEERWPQLQALLSGDVAALLYGEVKPLVYHLDAVASELPAPRREAIAAECRDFLSHFKARHDEWQFMRDGFAVVGGKPSDERGGGHTALSRVKLIYDAMAAPRGS